MVVDEEVRLCGPGRAGQWVCERRLLGAQGLRPRAGPHRTVGTGGWWSRKSGPACLGWMGRDQPSGVTMNSQLLGSWPVRWDFVLRQLCFHGVLLPGACDL